MNLQPRLLAAVLLVVAWAPGMGRAGLITTVDLHAPTVTASSATFGVFVTFPGSAGDTIEAIQISVLGSAPLLTNGGTDFSRFDFTPSGATLPGWVTGLPLSVSGVGLFVPPDPVTGPFLLSGSGSQQIGTLTVDLSGIAGGTLLTVNLAGGPPGQDTDFGGTVGGSFIPSFAGDATGATTVSFGQPDGVQFRTLDTAAVPEPTTAVLLGAGLLSLWAYRRATRRQSASARGPAA